MKEFLQFAVIGVGIGAAYALFAQGAVLIYRGSGIVNFGHGALGTFGGYMTFRELHLDGIAIVPAIIGGVVSAAAAAVLFDVLVLRALTRAAPLTRVIATLGLLTVVQAAVSLRYGQANHAVEPFLPHDTFDWYGIRVQEQVLYIVAVTALVTVSLWGFTKYTKIGLAITATAQDERAVQTLGWSPARIAGVVWAIGGALAGLAGILVAPLTGLSPIGFTIVITVAALASALLGGFRSFPLTALGGVLVGTGESLVTLYGGDIASFFNQDRITGLNRAVPFAVIFLVLIVQGRSLPVRSHLTDRLPRLGTGHINGTVLVVAVVVTSALLLGVFDEDWAAATFVSLAAGTILFSIVLLTGYAGQLSLGQWALAGSGAFLAASLVYRLDLPMELAIPAGALLTAPVGLLFALPALRTRGVNLAVVTLGLGFALSEVLFQNGRWVGDPLDGGTRIGQPRLFGIDVDAATHPHRWAVVCLVVFCFAGLVVANLRRSSTGLRLIAVRADERAAAANGISVLGAKLFAFAVAAVLAGLGGILLGFQSQIVTYTRYGALDSVLAVGNAVIGGVGYAIGAVLGAANAGGGLGSRLLENVFRAGEWDHLIGGVLLIVIIIAHQHGIADVMVHVAQRLRRALRSRRRSPVADSTAGTSKVASPPVPMRRVPPVELSVSNLTVEFGAVRAVDGVGFDLQPGEILGLIGPNGAGKTTIIDALTGFETAKSGRITLGGRPVDRLSATQRAQAGLRRSFQSLALFDDISVEDNIRCGSSGSNHPSSRWFTDLFWPRRERLDADSEAAVRHTGLDDALHQTPEQLPHGRRRLVGIARAVASAPSVLLLDEPAAGLDERETAELGNLIETFAHDRGMAILLVEHDMSLVMSVCDRLIVLDAGTVVATGTPEEIRSNAQVRKAYLGTERPASGSAPVPADERVADPANRRAPRVPEGSPALIEARDVSAGYAGMPVLRGVDLRVDQGEIVALVGANGAGKTTTLLTLAGVLPLLEGDLRWLDEPARAPMHIRCRQGMGYVTEERSVIFELNVAENLKLASVSVDAALGMFPELGPLLHRRAGLLSGGEQQMLALARALGRDPKVLLADELSLGLAPVIVERLLRAVRQAADERGVGVLLVEQHVQAALEIADRVYVLSRGSIAASGPAAEFRRDRALIEAAYLS